MNAIEEVAKIYIGDGAQKLHFINGDSCEIRTMSGADGGLELGERQIDGDSD